MPYKRRLRALWTAFDHPDWALQACAAATAVSAGRMEHRAAASAHLWEWADLVLTLDDGARTGLPALPRRIQVRHLDLTGAADSAARRILVEARVAGILGGLRLLDRIETTDDP